MIIQLSPQGPYRDFNVVKRGDVLTVNGKDFDFSLINDGDTLPKVAIQSEWFAGDVTKENGELTLTLILPLPSNYSPEQAFPVPLLDVPDGRVFFPKPLPDAEGNYLALSPLIESTSTGVIDWTQLVTQAMKDAATLAAHLVEMQDDLISRNTRAATQISRIQDRIDTLGYGIDAGEATAEDEAEQSALMVSIKAWKTYKFSLGKVTAQATWPDAPVWPSEPAPPVIPADPQLVTDEIL